MAEHENFFLQHDSAVARYILKHERRAEHMPEHTPETDTIYSRETLYTWVVTVDSRTINGGQTFIVKADSADHACAYICATKWISRTSLSARAE